MKNIKTAYFFLVAITVIAMAPTAAFALTGSSTGTSVGTTVASSIPTPSPASTGNSTGAIATPSPVVTGNSTGSVSIPSGEVTGNSTDSVTIPAGDSTGNSTGSAVVPSGSTTGNSTGSISAPQGQTTGNSTGHETTSNGNNTGNGSGPVSGGSSSSSGSSSGSGSFYAGYPGCAFSTGYLKFGSAGPEVTKLQNFLKNQGFIVSVTGNFDAQTKLAVEAFQAKYASEVLTPWDITSPTGYVYITTSKKINQLSCNAPLVLNASELAIINATKARIASGTATPEDYELIGSVTPGSTVAVGTTSTSNGKDITGSTTDSQVATATKAPILTRIWNFIKRIFGRN